VNFEIVEVAQGSPEWFSARAGLVTGSMAKAVLAKIKTGEAAARRDYRYELLCERLTGIPSSDNYKSPAMQWGTDQEPFARAAYEARTGNYVRQTGFVKSLDLAVGISLDGDINNFVGNLEIKCPKTATHVEYIFDDEVPREYMPQITHGLWITGAQWCDFVSYDPRLPENLQLFIKRVCRNDVDISAHESEVIKFLSELDELEKKILTKSQKVTL
jgi:putative phage-type endonuclease